MIYLDTHVAVWLYAGLTERFRPVVRERLNTDDLFISPIVVLELEYLYETGRTALPGEDIVESLKAQLDLRICERPFADVMRNAVTQAWTQDPFDRIIVGQAALQNNTLITKDRDIRAHYPHALWSEPQ